MFDLLTITGAAFNHMAEDRSVYSMTRKSQDLFKHEIVAGDVNVDVSAVRYSLTFRRVSWRFHNSTIQIGDSNTESLKFCDINAQSAKGTFGKAMPGKQVCAYEVEEINPFDVLGYSNVVLHCGINSIRRREIASHKDIKAKFDILKLKVNQIQRVNKNCKIYVCPTLPTKLFDYNRKAAIFNRLIVNDLVRLNLGVYYVQGFNSFMHKTGYLDQDLSRAKHDSLHLNGKGLGKLVSLVKSTIFGGKRPGSRRVNSELYSDIVANGGASTR